ncbi:MaoC family dehydratase N-terminal domain-containing protein [Sphingobium sp. V4]|uniref:FAS1-like dehydratase domain-containing protein n=1 Tax=Sphingobium sp. V4 TaxID=3038927 RepID=UPI00255810C5|nr:MaoC family dehydratase N-terminal domain-containing protein [Sphingobium sp. V4]WIW89410.1 MaoC family dehydratase N-terminal domain-containing protein [Sphingobium sp. V4]
MTDAQKAPYALRLGRYDEGAGMVGIERERKAEIPVSAELGRLFCSSIEDGNPSYWDETFAKSTWGSLIAPPAMLFAFGQPLAWSPGTRERLPQLAILVPLPGNQIINSRHQVTYLAPLRVGSRLSIWERLDQISEEKQSHLGKGHFVTVRLIFSDESGEAIAEISNTSFRFTADQESGPAAAAVQRIEVPSSPAEDRISIPDIMFKVSKYKAALGSMVSLDQYPAHYDLEYARAIGLQAISLNTMQIMGLFARFATEWAGPDSFLIENDLHLARPAYEGLLRVSGGVISPGTVNSRDNGKLVRIRAQITDAQGARVASANLLIRAKH